MDFAKTSLGLATKKLNLYSTDLMTLAQPNADQDVRARIVSIFEEVLVGLDVDETISVHDDLDSLDRMTLLMALEDEFDLSISESAAQELSSLDQLTDFVKINLQQ